MPRSSGFAFDHKVFLAAVCAVLGGAITAMAASQPIYNQHADARRDISAALSRAEKTGRNVVLVFGANW